MKIETQYTISGTWSDRESYEIMVDGKTVISVGTPEPEDATLSRDLSFAYDIVGLMKQAYDAGTRGETLSMDQLPDIKEK